MIVLGLDVSSSSTGIVEVVDGAMTDYAVWTPPKRSTRPAELLDYYASLGEWVRARRTRADLAVVEELSVTRGWKTVRALAHFEAVTYVVLEENEIAIRTIKPGAARNWVLGIPITSTKDVVLAEVRKQFPELKLPPANQGGGDVADAFVIGKSGPQILRRLG